jgi:hypothetical protein
MIKKFAAGGLLPALAACAVVALSLFAPSGARWLGPTSLSCYSYANQCGAPTVTNVSPNGGSPSGGTTVTITGTNFNNSGLVVHFGATSGTSAAIVSDTSVTVHSPAHAAGVVDVTVTTAAGTSATSAADHFTFGAVPCSSVGVTAAPASPQGSGTPVTFTGAASGCPNPLYQFWILAPGGAWTIVQAFSTMAAFNWNTSGLVAGTYMYTVWARDSGSAGTTCNSYGCYDALFPGTAYTLSTTKCTALAVTAAPASPQTSGTPVTFTGAASTCPHPLYQFWILAPGGAWTIVQAFSTTAAFNWNTTGLVAGTYMYTVWVRDSGSAGSTCNSFGCYDAIFPGTAYTLSTTKCTALAVTAAPASPQGSGTPVTFTGAASTCPHPVYQFWTLAPGGAWKIAQAFSSTAAFNWNTSGLVAGTYMYTVWVRDSGSAGSTCNSFGCYDAIFPGTAYTLTTTKCTALGVTAAPASPQGSGTPVTFTGAASTCPHPLYQFWILAPGGAWTIVQAFSTTAAFNWNTTGLVAGTYMYTVWVRDSGSAGSTCNSFGCYDAIFPGTAYTLSTTKCTALAVTAAPASPQTSGTPVTFTGVASTCPHPLYQFWILAPGGSWTIVQSFSTTAAFNWNTTGLVAGTYMYTVWVRDSGSAGSTCNSFGCYDAIFPGTAYSLT